MFAQAYPNFNFFANKKLPIKREIFAGTASYSKENKISSLVLIFVHFPAFIFAPIVLG